MGMTRTIELDNPKQFLHDCTIPKTSTQLLEQVPLKPTPLMSVCKNPLLFLFIDDASFRKYSGLILLLQENSLNALHTTQADWIQHRIFEWTKEISSSIKRCYQGYREPFHGHLHSKWQKDRPSSNNVEHGELAINHLGTIKLKTEKRRRLKVQFRLDLLVKDGGKRQNLLW